MSNTLSGISLGDLARASGGTLVGEDREISSVSTDSRSIASGDVYFCLSGDNYDGHDYAVASVAAGAVAVVCERRVNSGVAELVVPDARQAYGVLARLWRASLNTQLIGVTGSNGKTTVKQLLSEICAAAGSVHSTRANDNNDIGVPQTLLDINRSHQFGVVEMGANQLGEIRWLGSIAKPDVAIITNVSASHLEGFGSVEAVYREKSAIYDSLAQSGVAIVNLDDAFAEDWLALNRHREVITFGSSKNAQVYVDKLAGTSVKIHCQVPEYEGVVDAECNLTGNHNLMNVAAAAAAAIACGIDLAVIAHGVANAAPVKGRLNYLHLADGITVIDDTYNANPASTRAAMEVLASHDAERWLVLGDLGELGQDAAAHHTQLGEFACAGRVDRLFAVGDLSRRAVAAFGDRAEWFKDKEALCERLQEALDNNIDSDAASDTKKQAAADVGSANGGTVVLVKGSRSMAMDVVVNALQASYECSNDSIAAGAL